MDLFIAASVLLCVALGFCLWLLVRSSQLTEGKLPVTTDWLDELSMGRYRPMLRLLAGADLQFLSKQPGFTAKKAARFRAQRCRIVRGYLRSMQVDFGCICTALKIVMAQSQQDRPDLASALLRRQIAFTCGMVAVQFRLFLYRQGFGRVDAAGLVKVFDGMRLELGTLVPALSPMGA